MLTHPGTPYDLTPLAILIPARNESASVGETVTVLRQYTQADDCIIVIDDGSTDATAALAEQAGAKVVRRRRPAGQTEGSKGAALQWFVTAAGPELADYAGVIILDADTRVDRRFLDGIRARMASGAQAVQAFIMPSESDGSSVSSLASFSILLEQRLDDRLRAALGWPVRLRGTGMAFSPTILLWLVQGLRTHVEDVEMSLRLAAHDIQVVFAPEAPIFDPVPNLPVLAVHQRARWLKGQWAVWRLYYPDIARLLLRGPWAWSLVCSLLLKPRSLIVPTKVLGGVLAVALTSVWPVFGWTALLVMTSLVIDLMYFVLGLTLVIRPAALGSLPVSILAYVAAWLRSLRLALSMRNGWLRARPE